MKIKAPLTNKEEVKPLCDAGADELFCGIEPYIWRKKYRDFSINQRSSAANFVQPRDLEKAISAAHEYNVKVHITVNAFFHLEKQYKAAGQIITDVLNMGADGIIFADPVLLLNTDNGLLKNRDIIIGTDATVFNSGAVKFYKKLGATRVVLPRAITINEINKLTENDKRMEYEVFIIHDLCFFVDGFCTYCKEGSGEIKKEAKEKKVSFFSTSRMDKRGFSGGCRTRFKAKNISLKNHKQTGPAKPFTFWMKKHIQGCGACAIYDLEKAGITNLKILDRNLPKEEKIKATLFIKNSLNMLINSKISKEDYIMNCKKLFKKTFKVKCGRYDCYYPSIF
jgi:U32 family peptidase